MADHQIVGREMKKEEVKANAAVSRKHRVSGLLAISNFLAVILSILYLFRPVENLFTNLFGIFILLVILSNLIGAVFYTVSKLFNYLYLVFQSLSMIVVPIGNTVASADLGNISSRSSIAIAFLLLGFVAGCVFFGIGFLSTEDKADKNKSGVKTETRIHFVMKLSLLAFTLLLLISGIFVGYDLLTRRSAGIFEVFLPEYSLFYGFWFMTIAAIALKLSRNKVCSSIAGILGSILFIICLLPPLSVPRLLYTADKAYNQVFDAQSQMMNDRKEFKSLPFSIPEYFFGTLSGAYTVKENILYYQGTQGVDENIKLYFDVYQPVKDASELPGKGSALIRIHGGAWNIGDKGASNYAQVNKYFASQGYVVFDIQYGLNNESKFVRYAPVPKNVQGAFTIDDMVRHIGIFTTYLYDHKGEYSVNTDSVFISGGSAGGQLTAAVGLALANGNYSDLLDSRINVKGIIPFYPANGLAWIGGQKELVDPSLLVDKKSPPCLIYQGTHDGIVNPRIAKELKNAYSDSKNEKCVLIMMPFASHGSDFYFSSYYNQVFLYYMERFMLENQ